MERSPVDKKNATAGISPRRRKPEEAHSLVTHAYIKESTYKYEINKHKYTVSMLEKISICLNRGREESVGNDDVSIVCARKYEMVRMT